MSAIKKEICCLCGEEKKLTFEHVPPKKAFNNVKTKMIKYQDLIDNKKGTWQQKGAGSFTLCTDCNTRTGNWYAPTYIKFVSDILEKYPKIESLTNNQFRLEIKTYPLRLLKQILTMFFSLNGPNFQQVNHDLKNFVLFKESQELPINCYILIFLYSQNLPYRSGVMGELDNQNTHIYSLFSFSPLTIALCFDTIPSWGKHAAEISNFFRCNYGTEKNIILK